MSIHAEMLRPEQCVKCTVSVCKFNRSANATVQNAEVARSHAASADAAAARAAEEEARAAAAEARAAQAPGLSRSGEVFFPGCLSRL